MARNEIAINSENKPKKRRVGNPAMTGDAYNLEPGDNSRAIQAISYVRDFPKIDLHTATPEEVDERLLEYFKRCNEIDFKPTVNGMAAALWINRNMLWAIVNDQPVGGNGYGPTIPRAVADVIKRHHSRMIELWEYYMQNGKINPVSGIFLGKNHFGYQDRQDVVVTPKQADDFNPADVQQRYLDDSSDS